MRLPFLSILIASVALCSVSGCGGAAISTNATTQVRVINLLKTTSNASLDVVGSFDTFASGTIYGDVLGYQSASNTAELVDVLHHSDPSIIVVPAATYTFSPNTKTTLLLTGTEGNTTTFIPSIITVNDNTLVPTGTDYKLRIINGSQFAGAVDLYILPFGAAITTAAPVVSNIGYGDVSTYIENPHAANLSFIVVPAGQKAPPLASFPSQTPADAGVYTIVLKDNVGTTTGTLLTDQ